MTAPSKSNRLGTLTNPPHVTPLRPGSTVIDGFSRAIYQKIADFNSYPLRYQYWKSVNNCGVGTQWRNVWWIRQGTPKRLLLLGAVTFIDGIFIHVLYAICMYHDQYEMSIFQTISWHVLVSSGSHFKWHVVFFQTQVRTATWESAATLCQHIEEDTCMCLYFTFSQLQSSIINFFEGWIDWSSNYHDKAGAREVGQGVGIGL